MAKKKPSGSPETQARRKREKDERSRKRNRARWIRVGAVAALVAAALVTLMATASMRENAVRDLSGIGQGVPAVVQVYDVGCPICNQNRANVDRIADEFDDDSLLLRVADIRDEDGLRFAAQFTDRRRQTMLLLDGDGALVDIIEGPASVEELRDRFTRHAAAN